MQHHWLLEYHPPVYWKNFCGGYKWFVEFEKLLHWFYKDIVFWNIYPSISVNNRESGRCSN